MKLYPNISLIFLTWCLGLFTVTYFGFSSFPHSGKFSGNYLMSLANWDGGHYLGIAQHGYSELFQYAFFPLYPLLIRALNTLTQNYLVAALLISVVSSFLALNLLYRLIAQNFGKIYAQKAILAIIFFPTSFYFLTAYSEGLFFLLVVATFFFIARGKFFWATVAVSLASATRLAGLALVLALLVCIQITGGISRKNWYVAFAPLGFVIYCWYLFTKTSDPFYFITAENNWQRTLSIPGISFWETIRNLTMPDFISQYPHFLTDLIFAIFGVGMMIRCFRFLPPIYSLYGFLSILLPLLTSSLLSMPRFLLPIFPIFITLALWKNEYVQIFYQVISLMLLSVFATLFINGYWVS